MVSFGLIQEIAKLTGEMFAYKGNSFVVKWRDRSMELMLL
jgi:hypothetical protein